jgi:hypothetical protein
VAFGVINAKAIKAIKPGGFTNLICLLVTRAEDFAVVAEMSTSVGNGWKGDQPVPALFLGMARQRDDQACKHHETGNDL